MFLIFFEENFWVKKWTSERLGDASLVKLCILLAEFCRKCFKTLLQP